MEALVSVIMGVHNENPEYLRTAIGSICRQSYGNWEFIIIEDAANAGCKALLADFERHSSKIRVFHNEENLGLTRSLNIGLANAKGEYVARMDADDWSVPDRIEKQVRFLESNPDIDLCGTGVVSFGERRVFMSPHNGMTNEEVQCCLFFSSALCHPSVMARKSFLDRHGLAYDESVKAGQDYDLWERCSIHGKLAVMSEVLLFYRIHGGQITSRQKELQDTSAGQTRLRRLSRLGIVPDEKEYKCHLLLMEGKDRTVAPCDIDAWIARITGANRHVGLVDEPTLCRDLARRRMKYLLRNGRFGKALGAGGIKLLGQLLLDRLAVRLKLCRESRRLKTMLRRESNEAVGA